MNGKKIVLAVLAAFIFSGAVLAVLCLTLFQKEEEKEIRIIHAAGEVRDSETGKVFLGSNSLEGLEQTDAAGERLVELDFNFTSDGKLACVHDWYRQYSSAITDHEALSLSDFMNCKIFYRFTPLDLDTLAAYLKSHEGLQIVTDIKDRNIEGAALIAKSYPELRDRFIIQIYQFDEYEPVRALGFENIILTLYNLHLAEDKTDTAKIVAFAKSHPLYAITFPAELARQKGYVAALRQSGTRLLTHTINGPQTQEEYYKLGIDGVYTDYRQGTADEPEEIR